MAADLEFGEGLAETVRIVAGFHAAKGILTSEGGKASHAALVARGMGVPAVTGAAVAIDLEAGKVTVDGHDIIKDYRAARSLIGLVPQELHTDAFESVWATVSFSRGLFGKPRNPAHIEKVLKDLSLWDKKDAKIVGA